MNDQLYVRTYHGPASLCCQSAMAQRGRITAAGGQWEVSLEAAAEDLNDVVDAAYRQKYPANPYLSHMIGTNAPGRYRTDQPARRLTAQPHIQPFICVIVDHSKHDSIQGKEQP